MRIRIKDIAARARVSPGTVDRVIHNRGEVSEATRKKIMAIVKELNYEPDILASNLASKRQFHIATLLPACNDLDSAFWLGPHAGVQRALEEIDHFNIKVSHFEFNLYAKESFSEQAQKLLSRNPDGVALTPIYAQEAIPLLNELTDRAIPYVMVNSAIPNYESRLSFIGQDSFQSGLLAAKLMHFGLVGSFKILILNLIRENSTQRHIQQRETGFREYFKQFPNVQLETVNINGVGQEMVDNELRRFLIPSNGIGGVFVTNSKVYKAAHFMVRNRVKNVRLVGYDLVETSRSFLEKGTIDFLINQRSEEQGYRGIMSLFQHIVLKKSVEPNQYMPLDIITKENLKYYR